MIYVKQILGESFDFSTNQEQPKALVLSNGNREVLVPIDDSTAMQVLQLQLLEPEPEPQEKLPTPDAPSAQGLIMDIPPTLGTAKTVVAEGLGEYDDPDSGTASI